MAANSPIPQSLLSPPTAQEENSKDCFNHNLEDGDVEMGLELFVSFCFVFLM